jgi:long-chain acyl-CoA synthetase
MCLSQQVRLRMQNTPQEQGFDSNRAGDVIEAAQAQTLWGLFRERVRRSPDAVAYRHHDRAQGRWLDHSWAIIAQRVEQFRSALAKENMKPGDRVAILLPNGIDWVCLDLAAHGSGLIVVGLYPHDTAASNAHILGHSGARLVLLDNEARWKSLWPLRTDFPTLERVWISDLSASYAAPAEGPVVRRLGEALANTATPRAAHQASPSDVAAVIYTSGTGGKPKGVMLSHTALLWNARATAAVIPPRPDDVFLSIMPIAHAFERTVGYYLPMLSGCTVAYARSPQNLTDDLAAVRPTVMLGVPLLFERMQTAIRAKAATGAMRRALLQITVAIGWRRFLASQQRRNPGLASRLIWPLLERNIARPVRAAFGGRLRVAVSGGAALDPSVSRTFIGLGLPLIEGYGLAEAAPVVTANRLDDNLPGSVGRPLQGIEVKLGAEDELMVRTPSVMTGYWQDDIRTRQTIDADGWLSTGDVAELKDDRVFLRGRLSDMIVLSNGEKVDPNITEGKITTDTLFLQALVVGNRRPFPVAVIVLDAAAWSLFAANEGLDPRQPNDPASKIELQARIVPLLASIPRYAQVRAAHFTVEPWTIEAGLLTPTLKVKRDRVIPVFAQEIDQLYREQTWRI